MDEDEFLEVTEDSDGRDSEGSESDGDDLGIAMDTESSSKKRDAEEYLFEVLTPERIMMHMCDIIRDVNNVLQLPTTVVRILLNHYKWDREKLMETYYSDDPEKIFTDAHIISPFGAQKLGSKASSSSAAANVPSIRYPTRQSSKPSSGPTIMSLDASGDEECQICLNRCPSCNMTGLECSHRFCSKCWAEYLTTKVMDDGMGQTISCAAHNCGILVDDATAMKLLKDNKVKLRYQHLITNNFVESNRLMRWCPSPDCPNAVKVQYSEAKPVTCKCGHTFCFSCGHEWHDPVNCKLLRRWIKKCNDDSETSNWIAANTKECPKCHVTVEKDGGCNHMVCKNSNCKMEYCWVCLGPWEPHGSSWYNCNRFDDGAAKQARDAQEKSRSALQRYLFYCNRYMNHMQSLKFENKLYASVKAKMEEMQQHNMSWIEVQFLKKAVDVLCLCRRTLMYTYVFAYYANKNNQVEIFEDNQRDLENATETLSEYLERELTADNIASIKQKVQDKYRYCEQRRIKLLDHCHEGNEKDSWDFNDI